MAEFTSVGPARDPQQIPLSPMDRWAEPSIVARIFLETVGPALQ